MYLNFCKTKLATFENEIKGRKDSDSVHTENII